MISQPDYRDSGPAGDTTCTGDLVIAALGASAGGLDAFEEFLTNMAPDSGIGFILVQHLSPDRATSLPELLSRNTLMPVTEAKDGTCVLPNHVYIIPPNATLTIKDGVLVVKPPSEARGQRTPIDSLFTSLARDCGEKAVCILLSGTGSDGTLGLKAIKEHGGLALVQTLESAKYDSILRSAISTGLVDHILPVHDMPAKLLEYVSFLRTSEGRAASIREQLSPHLARVHSLLRRKVGHDFSQYKENTVSRRLARRMKALQLGSVEEYVHALETNPEEADRLFNDLLIGVTHFFRDPEAFDALAREVIPRIFAHKGPGDQIRACVVGCATGEEAYSLAILLSEYAAGLPEAPAIKVFATDIDDRGLEVARRGVYPAGISEHVSPERLERFFVKQDDTWQVRRELREICIFTSHSFIKDPPFARQDLISCRNVMIYLGAELQRRIIPLFHYALRPDGYLFLGPSESASSHKELFQVVDSKYRIFRKKEVVGAIAPSMPVSRDIARPRMPGNPGPDGDQTLPKQLARIILQRYGPVCVAVKENGDAVYFSGPAGRYFQPAVGTPDNNVVTMAREGLRIPIRTALFKAVSSRERIVQHAVAVEATASENRVNLTVEPIHELPAANLFMVLLESVEASDGHALPAQPLDAAAAETIRSLESELRAAHEQAQAMLQELESSNEELKSANEEFQSANEELETSKEEAQSFNEELSTVNQELNRRVLELDHANSYLQNLNDSIQIATIFLDTELRIRSFTSAAIDVFHLINGDIGRPFTDLATQFSQVDLIADLRQVLATLAVSERALAGSQGRHYLLRAMPYRTVNNVIDGVVMTFTDVTRLKHAEEIAEQARQYAESIVETIREPLLVLDADLRIKSANAAFFRLFESTEALTVGCLLFEFGERQWDIPELRQSLEAIVRDGTKLEDFHVRREFPRVGVRTLLVNGRLVARPAAAPPLILMAIEDITARSEAEDALREVNRDLQHFAFAASHDLQEPLRMIISYSQLLANQFGSQLGAEGNKFVQRAIDGALRMELLLRGLRDYWAVNEHSVTKDATADVNSVLAEVLTTLEAKITETRASVTCDLMPVIRADRLPLVLLFQNLVGNAIKYSRDGEPPCVHISVQSDGGQWHFRVSDKGLGIDPKYAESIFRPFKRLHGQGRPGSGLGLAICQRVVDRYKGRIWVESAKGQGSTFHVILPP